MKIKERWEFKQIHDNPDGFKKFLLSRFDIDKCINIYQNNTFPINCSNRTKSIICKIREIVFEYVKDNEIKSMFNSILKEDVNWYVEELLKDILIDFQIRDVMKTAKENNMQKYQMIEKSVYNTLRTNTKSKRCFDFIHMEQMFNVHYKDTKNNKNDNFTLEQSIDYLEQWEHAWCMHYLLSSMIKWVDGRFANNFIGYNGFIKSTEKFQKTMDLLLENNNDSDWFKAYENLYELSVAVEHALGDIFIENRKELYE